MLTAVQALNRSPTLETIIRAGFCDTNLVISLPAFWASCVTVAAIVGGGLYHKPTGQKPDPRHPALKLSMRGCLKVIGGPN